MSINPDQGVLESDSEVDITVTYDTSLLMPGSYNATIKLFTNDPDNRITDIPVQLTVKRRIKSDPKFKPSDPSTSSALEETKCLKNYPNPFNPETTIAFHMQTSAMVTVKIYDIVGREVETLVNDYYHAGDHRIKWNAAHMPSGVYFCVLRTGTLHQSKKIILKK